MTEPTPAPEDFLGKPEPAIWAEVERYAKQSNDDFAAALLSLRAKVEQLEANAKPTSNPPQTRPSGITPPPELVQEWVNSLECPEGWGPKVPWIAARAAQWGADTELEACVEWISKQNWAWTSGQLRAARRPKSPSLKQQSLELLDKAEDPYWCINDFSIVRRALEQLDD